MLLNAANTVDFTEEFLYVSTLWFACCVISAPGTSLEFFYVLCSLCKPLHTVSFDNISFYRSFRMVVFGLISIFSFKSSRLTSDGLPFLGFISRDKAPPWTFGFVLGWTIAENNMLFNFWNFTICFSSFMTSF